eukprot:scaffold931_cov383-Prasinococcus_capsulatus_cf.AAC.15
MHGSQWLRSVPVRWALLVQRPVDTDGCELCLGQMTAMIAMSQHRRQKVPVVLHDGSEEEAERSKVFSEKTEVRAPERELVVADCAWLQGNAATILSWLRRHTAFHSLVNVAQSSGPLADRSKPLCGLDSSLYGSRSPLCNDLCRTLEFDCLGRRKDPQTHTGDALLTDSLTLLPVPDVQEDLIPVVKAWELNERMYGELQGLNKAETAEKYGQEQVKIWRRSYDIPPPNGESLEMTAARAVKYFKEMIIPELKAGNSVMVSAHGNSLRAIIMYMEDLSPEEVVLLELLTGIPLVYEYSGEGGFVRRNAHSRVCARSVCPVERPCALQGHAGSPGGQCLQLIGLQTAKSN